MIRPVLDVVTLYEGHYDHGLGALLNSLVAVGFAGTAWVGYRGRLPRWLSATHETSSVVQLTPQVQVRFVPVHTERHLANHKATFLLELLDHSTSDGPGSEGVVYFDPDIVVTQSWESMADWVAAGVAVCADVNPWFPATHPVRRQWLALAAELGDRLGLPPVDLYVNAGFVGCTRERSSFLCDWERYTVAMAERGPGLRVGPGTADYQAATRTGPFMIPDQDALNLTVMAHAAEVAMMGPQAMGLAPGWPLMRHAIGQPKPWMKRFALQALTGRAPTKADRAFLRHTAGAVEVWPPWRRALAHADLRLGQVVGRLSG